MTMVHNVQSMERPLPLEVNIDTVYKRYNIHQTEEGYEYDEEQYEMIEYLRDVIPQLELAIAELSALIGGGVDVR